MAAVDELAGGAMVVALCEALGRPGVLVVMVAADEEENTVEMIDSIVVRLEVAMGREVGAGVVVAEVVVSAWWKKEQKLLWL